MLVRSTVGLIFSALGGVPAAAIKVPGSAMAEGVVCDKSS